MPQKDIVYAKKLDVSAASGSVDVNVAGYAGFVTLGMLSAIAGGTTPSIVFTAFAVDEFNNEHQMFTVAAIDTLNEKFTSVQHVMLQSLVSDLVRFRWTTTGAPTTAVIDLSVYGYSVEK